MNLFKRRLYLVEVGPPTLFHGRMMQIKARSVVEHNGRLTFYGLFLREVAGFNVGAWKHFREISLDNLFDSPNPAEPQLRPTTNP